MMEHMSPVITVIMPAYNQERFIEKAIRSVQEQTFSDWALLVLDDGSTDATCAIVERLAAGDKRIQLIRNEKNMGVAFARNRGFDLCNTPYAALLDSDDIWLPEKLEKQLALARETGVDIVYCSYAIVDAEGNRCAHDFIVPSETNYRDSMWRSVISCSTALLSKRIIETYRFDSHYYHEDLALWLQLLKDGYSARGCTEVLAQYRLLTGSRASNKINSALARWRILRNYLGLSWFECVRVIAKYAVLGLKKYHRYTDKNTIASKGDLY